MQKYSKVFENTQKYTKLCHKFVKLHKSLPECEKKCKNSQKYAKLFQKFAKLHES